MREVDFTATVWKDNRDVTLLSSYVSSWPDGKVTRYGKKVKLTIDIACLQTVQEYNVQIGEWI